MHHVLAPLAGALALSACSPSPAARLAKAQEELARQNYTAARLELGAALRENPDNPELQRLLIAVHLRLGDGERAQGMIEQLRRGRASSPDLTVMEAEAQLLRGQAETALRLLGDTATSDGWRVRAAAMLMLGREGDALTAFRRGLAQGGDVRLAGDFARFLLTIGDTAAAAQQLARLERERPAAIETLMLVGALAEARGDTDAALRKYRAAQQRYPWLAAPLVAQANIMDLLGKLDEAARLGEAAGQVQPDDVAVIDLQLSIYAQQGQWDKIRLMLQRRELSLNPASAAGLTYAEALLRLDHPEHARAILSKALLIEPANRYARMMLGEAQLATGDARSALVTLRPLVGGVFVYPREVELAERAAAAAGDPLGAELRARRESGEFRRRSVLIEQGLAATARANWPAALEAWRQLQTLGEDAELLRRIADCASLSGAHTMAIASADKAMTLQPGDAELLHLAGAVRLAAGLELARARTLLEAAAELAPANPQFRAALAKARSAPS